MNQQLLALLFTRRALLKHSINSSVIASALTLQNQVKAQAKPPELRAAGFAPVVPEYNLRFPRDHGAHPEFRIEWWYITGWLAQENGDQLGMQITFFRTATGHARDNPSRLAPKQLLFAHLAIADPKTKQLFHDQQAARAGISSFFADESDTNLKMRYWTLTRRPDDSYVAKGSSIYLPKDKAIEIDLQFKPGREPQLQGVKGYSRKGPNPAQASYYYSRPQMTVSGTVSLAGRTKSQVTGTAWLDHEWSTSLLDERAIGWDWIGINLTDGGSLMAFQLRSKDGIAVWSYVVLRDARGQTLHAANESRAAEFLPKRFWKSRESGATYPVAQTLRCAQYHWQIEPLFDAQEIDARASTGGFYWEGAVSILALNTAQAGQTVGRGYLEMTGYAAPIKLS
jgi:predicted secreted hydrolase